MILTKEASDAIGHCHSCLDDFCLPIFDGRCRVVGLSSTLCALIAISYSDFCSSVNDGVHAHLVSHDKPSCVAIEFLYLYFFSLAEFAAAKLGGSLVISNLFFEVELLLRLAEDILPYLSLAVLSHSSRGFVEQSIVFVVDNFDLFSAVRGPAFKGNSVGIMVFANKRVVFSLEGLRSGQQSEGH